jgi:hypothetical protein
MPTINYSIISRTRIVNGFGGIQYTSVCNPLAQYKMIYFKSGIRPGIDYISRLNPHLAEVDISDYQYFPLLALPFC